MLLTVLSNDTDADGDTLTIHGFETLPQWGTVQIVDGPDADSLIGDAILYTPFADYPTLGLATRSDSFVYCISDGNGGTDYATVTIDPITPVADIPLVSWELLPVLIDGVVDISKINIRVTATQTDDDGSEFIDRILATVSGGLPSGATITPGIWNPGTTPLSYTNDFLLTLDPTKDYDFDIVFDAWSEEVVNGDQQKGSSDPLSVVFDYNSVTQEAQFLANDQSIWATGDEFKYTDNRFIGVDEGPGSEKFGSTLYAGLDYRIKLGFQSTLVFEGGAIDANATQDITIETGFNRTLDVLQISSSKVLQNASFTTQGPRGTYDLDFIYDLYLKAYAGLSLDFGDLGTWNEYTDFGGPIVNDSGSEDILSLTSEDLSYTLGLPAGFSLDFAWPNISVTDSFPTDAPPLVESGASNNFLQLNLDVDDLAATLLGLPVNPFDVGFDIGIVYANLQLLDVDVFAGLNFIQEFTLGLDSITGQLVFEDGTSQAYTIGDDVVVSGASLIDQNGNNALGIGTQGNGKVEFKFVLDQQATLGNNTDLGFNVGYNIDVLKGEAGYDVGIDSGSTSFGPVASIGDKADVFSVDIYGSTFGLDFQSQQLLGYA